MGFDSQADNSDLRLGTVVPGEEYIMAADRHKGVMSRGGSAPERISPRRIIFGMTSVAVLFFLLSASMIPSVDGFERPPPVTNGSAGANVTYDIDLNSMCITFEGSGPMYDYDDPDVPPNDPRAGAPPWSELNLRSAIIEKGVTRVGDSALRYNPDIASVSLPDGLESIGTNAFSGTSITLIDLPDTLTSIGTLAFFGTRLTAVTVPDSVETIGGSAFAKNVNLATVVIGDGVRILSQGLVADTPVLTSFTIGKNVTAIERWLTSGSGLKDLCIPGKVAWISPEAFSTRYLDSLERIDVEPGNEYYSSSDGILFNNDKSEIVRFLPTSGIAEYYIPDGVESISPFAFYMCISLERVVLPDSVGYIGKNAFGQCTGMKYLSISDGVTQIDKSGVDTGSVLEYLYIGSGMKAVDGTIVPSLGSAINIHIGAGVTHLDYETMRQNPYLKSITVDLNNPHFASVNGALYNNNIKQLLVVPGALTGHFIMPNSVTHISDNSFRYSSLSSVTLSNDLSVIGRGAFAGTSLTSIKIPLSVKIIGDDAFAGCSNMTMIHFEGGALPTIGRNAFDTGGSEAVRVYSAMTPGFLDRYSGDTDLAYYDSEASYASIVDEMARNTAYILVAIVILSVSLVGIEVAISKKSRR